MEIIDNVTRFLGDDLKRTMVPGAKVATVDELADLYKALIEQRDKVRRENGDPRA